MSLDAGTVCELEPFAFAGATRAPASPAKTPSHRVDVRRRRIASQVAIDSSRSEGAMFKHRKRAPGDRPGWRKRFSALVAAVGGVVGGLLFWRKRKGS
jgi:hypothetical protein